MPPESLGTALGSIALSRGWISEAQLREALDQQIREAAERKTRKLGVILLEKGYISAEQLAELLELQSPPPAAAPGLRGPMPPGSTFGKYTIQAQLGQGGMGVVYLALDRDLDRRVALKFLHVPPHEELRPVAQDEERFLRESRLAANLPKHPHVVGVYEGGVVDGQRFLAMEYIEGRPFNEWHSEAPSLLARMKVLRDVARAVHHAHEHGVIHRDLKPQNILVDTRGEPHVTDFGLAKGMQPGPGPSLTAPDLLVGTPAYMSPEQARLPKSVDRRSDVYALGVMLYEVMTGEVPFLGDTPLATIVKAAHESVPLPSTRVAEMRRAEIDAELEKIVMKALAKNAGDRHPTAAALADELSAWIAAREANVRVRRPKGVWAVVAVGVALAVCAAFLIADRKGPQPPAPPGPAPAIMPVSLELLLGESGGAAGLALVRHEDGPYEAAYHQGKTCVKLLGGRDPHRRLYFDVAEAHSRRPGMVEVLVDWFDVPVGQFIAVEYDSSDGRHASGGVFKLAGKVYSRGSGTWKTARFLLSNPRFRNGQFGKADFRILATNADLHFHRVVFRDCHQPDVPASPQGVLTATAVNAASLIPGLAGHYYSDPDFKVLAHQRADAGTSFGWNAKAWPGGPDDRFSVRWTGYLRVPETGPYLFELLVDDIGKVFVDDHAVIPNAKGRAPVTAYGYCVLEAGFHRLRLELSEYEQRAEFVFSCFAHKGRQAELLGPESFSHVPK